MSVTEPGGVPGRLVWPVDLWRPGGADELACAIGAVHAGAHAVVAVAGGHQVALVSVTLDDYPGSVILAQAGPDQDAHDAVGRLVAQEAVMRYLASLGATVPGWYALTNYWTRRHYYSALFAPGEAAAIEILARHDGWPAVLRMPARGWDLTRGHDIDLALGMLRSRARDRLTVLWGQILTTAQRLADARGYLDATSTQFTTALSDPQPPQPHAPPAASWVGESTSLYDVD